MLERVETNVHLGVKLSLRQSKFLLGGFRSDVTGCRSMV